MEVPAGSAWTRRQRPVEAAARKDLDLTVSTRAKRRSATPGRAKALAEVYLRRAGRIYFEGAQRARR
ncbi:MAG TPA: hypothetical protein VNO18_04045 [Xanthobacteraceae bacterium]|nr:hypothetical protein [Xanthobacteraceae bacterium]